MLIDYKQLNSNTILDSFPLPYIDKLLLYLNEVYVFNKFDLQSGYYELPMYPIE